MPITQLDVENIHRLETFLKSPKTVTLTAHRNMETAAETELARASQGYESHAFGDINGEAYLIVYFKGAQE